MLRFDNYDQLFTVGICIVRTRLSVLAESFLVGFLIFPSQGDDCDDDDDGDEEDDNRNDNDDKIIMTAMTMTGEMEQQQFGGMNWPDD